MRDIEIAEQEFKKWWNAKKKSMRGFRSEEERKQYEMALHEGFVKGFFVALEKVDSLFKEARGENYGVEK